MKAFSFTLTASVLFAVIRIFLKRIVCERPNNFPINSDFFGYTTIHDHLLDGLAEIQTETNTNLTACAEEWSCAVRVATNASGIYNFTQLWTVPRAKIENHVRIILFVCPNAENITK